MSDRQHQPAPTRAANPPRPPIPSRRRRDDRGEGVISAAIAVLVMAFLGALMWVGFQQMWETTQQQTNDQITRIGG
jgi:uncharacterized protein HemX